MYPAPFEYVQAGSWHEAVEFLSAHGDEAKVLAGGQSLVPMMSLRLAKPGYLVDVNGADTPDISEADGHVRISAVTRHADLERSPVLAKTCPLIKYAARLIGNVRVRHRGTIGGSLAHADPAAELPCAAVALGARICVLGPSGERRIPAGAFFVGYFTTALEPDEVIVAVEIPVHASGQGSAFLELVRRAGDFAIVEVAAVVDLDPRTGICNDLRLVVGAIADRPVDLSDPASQLVGGELDDSAIAAAVRHVGDSVHPREDDRASAGYRREMIAVLARRALLRARDLARGNGVSG